MKKRFDDNFYFVLDKKLKKHIRNKANKIGVSMAEYIRLLTNVDKRTDEVTVILEKSSNISNEIQLLRAKIKY